MPEVGHTPFDQCDPHSKRLRRACKMDRGEMAPEHIRNARHAYYGQISFLDDKIGRILQALDVTGMRGNTVVMLTADHGDMLGERGLWYKMSLLEGAARVPLIINAPWLFSGKRVSTPVSLVDLLPTLLELACAPELEAPVGPLDGRSLVPLARDGDDPGRGAVIAEYMGEGAIAPMIMIRDQRFKYIHCPVDPPLLYDLENDPRELRNLADAPAHAELLKKFQQAVERHVDLKDLDTRVRASQERRKLVFRAHMKGRHTSWDYHPPCNAANQYMRNHLDLNNVEAGARLPG